MTCHTSTIAEIRNYKTRDNVYYIFWGTNFWQCSLKFRQGFYVTKVRKGLSRSSRPISPRSASFSMVLLYSFLHCEKKTIQQSLIHYLALLLLLMQSVTMQCKNHMQTQILCIFLFFPAFQWRYVCLIKGWQHNFIRNFLLFIPLLTPFLCRKRVFLQFLNIFFLRFNWVKHYTVKGILAVLLSWLSLLCVHPSGMIIFTLLMHGWRTVLTNIQENLLCAVWEPYTKLVYNEGETHRFWQIEIWDS